MKTVKQKGMKSLGKSRDEIEKNTSSKSPSFDEAGHKGDGQSPADSKPSIKKAKVSTQTTSLWSSYQLR